MMLRDYQVCDMMLIGEDNWMFGFVADECVFKAPSYTQDASLAPQLLDGSILRN